MANSTTNLDQLIQSQASKEAAANALWDAMSQGATYGRRASTTSGLTWGFYGGNVVLSSGAYAAIANGTLTLTGSATNYVVALKADGVVSFATVSTNWDNVDAYWRLYRVVTGASTITSYTDDRQSSFIAVAGNGGNGAAVAVIVPDGTERRITESQTWPNAASAEDNVWIGIDWSPELGLFAAVANSGTNRVMTSPDGVVWTARTISSRDWRAITWAPELGLFVAVAAGGAAAGQVATSLDGITWTDRTSSQANEWRSITWSPELTLLVAVASSGTNRVMTSPDGITWTNRTAAAANIWNEVRWSPQLLLFAAVSESGTNRVMTSPDGITWTSRSAAAANLWGGLTWSPYRGLFVACSRDGTNRIMTSPDGITWTSRSAAAAQQWSKVTWCDTIGLFVSTTQDTVAIMQSSPDGITWTSRTTESTNSRRGVVWAPALGLFAAVAVAGVGNRVTLGIGYAGVYTPVLTAVANVAASTAFPMRWERRGKNVTVFGQVNIQATAGATNTQLGMSIPLSATFAAEDMLSGSATAGFVTVAGSYVADTSNARAEFRYLSESTSNRAMRGSFNYRLV